MVQLSLVGRIEYADMDYVRLLDRSIDDIIGRSFLDFVEEPARDPAAHRFRTLVRDGLPVVATKQYSRPDGRCEPTTVLTNASLLRDPDGEPVGVVGIEQRIRAAGASIAVPRR